MSRHLPLLLLLIASAASAAPAAQPRKRDWLSGLTSSISAYLNAPTVRKAPKNAAVAAVRGGIPTDQGENLDLRLLDRAGLLRQRLLAAPDAAEEAALSRIYQALAVSQWVQALETDQSQPTVAQETAYALRAWTGSQSDLTPSLRTYLQGPAKAMSGKALVEAGWAPYARGLTPVPGPSAAAATGRAIDPDTAKLDELLKSLQEAWTGKTLTPAAQAKAHQLAGKVYTLLSQADVKGSAQQASSGGSAPAIVLPSAPARPAPAVDEAPAQEFVPKAIYSKASKAVVLILCTDKDGSGELGSGSIIGGSMVLTNAHVVIRDSTRQPWPTIHVYLKPAKMTGDPRQDMQNPMSATVRSWDSALDLAVIDLADAPPGLPRLSLADPEEVGIGDRVAAIGHPEQGGLWTLTTGVVSTLIADLGGVKGKGAFQTDASINRGNSGGPLLNASGDIIGVNTLMSRKAADGLAITAVNFAVRSDIARRWLEGKSMTVAYAPQARAPQQQAAKPSAPSEAAPAPKPKRVTITESRPFDREKLIEEEMKEMDEMGDDMHDEIMRKSGH